MYNAHMNVEIVQKGHPALHSSAQEVDKEQINSDEIKSVISDMKRALATEPKGVAIAAPQIGVSKRIFLVKGAIIGEGMPDTAFINPVITKLSKRTEVMEEGCLSVDYFFGTVVRHKNATIEAYNEHGEKIIRGAGGLLAHIFQHEVDHLDGVLYTDKAETLEELTQEEKDTYDKQRNERKAKLG